MYRWEIVVLEWDRYGEKVEKRTPMSILGDTREQVTAKVRAAFGASFNEYRTFWSHSWTLKSVTEERPDALPEGKDK